MSFFILWITISYGRFIFSKVFEGIIEILKKNNDKNDGDWLVGYGWDQNQWEDKNWPNNELLNKNFKNLNVVLNRIDGHAIMVNETAIKTAKVPLDTVVSGGYIEKIDGKVTGIFMDNAMSLILEKIPEANEESKEKSIIKSATRLYFSRTNHC